MKTHIHTYHFDIRVPSEKAEYLSLCKKLRATPGRGDWMESHGRSSHWLNDIPSGSEIELETKHLFDNQWNTGAIGKYEKGLRVFDWAQDYNPNGNPYIKRGHYLDITPEMVELRDNTHKCGYCGKQEPAQKGYAFCPHCLDSAYLTEKDLHLTRMRPCSAGLKYKSPELSEAEKAHLLPLFKSAQIHGQTERGKVRIAKARADLLATRDSVILHANREFNGFTWLMDNGVNTENCIYYKHTGVFSFGWRNPVDSVLLSSLLDVITEFPYAYEIKCADGRTLKGE